LEDIQKEGEFIPEEYQIKFENTSVFFQIQSMSKFCGNIYIVSDLGSPSDVRLDLDTAEARYPNFIWIPEMLMIRNPNSHLSKIAPKVKKDLLFLEGKGDI